MGRATMEYHEDAEKVPDIDVLIARVIMISQSRSLIREVASARKLLRMSFFIFTPLRQELNLAEETLVGLRAILLLCMVLDMDYRFRNSMQNTLEGTSRLLVLMVMELMLLSTSKL